MAPTVNRGYQPQSHANPFAHLSQQQHHQQSHLQHPTAGLHSNAFSGAHHAFGGGQNGGLGLFGAPQQQQAGNGAFGSSHHQQLAGFASVQHLHAQAQAQGHHGLAQHDVGATARDRIREVWKGNLEDEFAIIRALLDEFPYVSMVRATIWFPCCGLTKYRIQSFQE
jgi:CCR4-NOT transcription complex subunit 7/8